MKQLFLVLLLSCSLNAAFPQKLMKIRIYEKKSLVYTLVTTEDEFILLSRALIDRRNGQRPFSNFMTIYADGEITLDLDKINSIDAVSLNMWEDD